MNKFPINKKYLTISLYALIIIIISVLFEKAVGNFSGIWNILANVGRILIRVLSPFFYGLLIAYLLNPAVKAIEKVFSKVKYLNDKKNAKRVLSIFSAYFIVIGFVVLIFIFLLPEIIASLQRLFVAIQSSIKQMESNGTLYNGDEGLIGSMLDSFNSAFSTNYTLDYIISIALEPVLGIVYSIPDFISKIYSMLIGFAYAALDVVLGMFIAFYMLCEKDHFSTLISKVIYIVFKRPTAEKIFSVSKNSNTMFEKFFIGKTIDSTIIGLIFFVICLIVKAKYTVLLSIIMGVTNMIPYFGPFMGAVPIILIVLTNDPVLAMWMIPIIFALQQFDGIILGPKILGDSTGIKPIGVIFAIIVGGASFGVLGMFFGVPVFAVISSAIGGFIDKKYFSKFSLVAEKNNVNEHKEQ